jgi:hypothetical protein
MKTHRFRQKRFSRFSFDAIRRALPVFVALAGLLAHMAGAQATNQVNLSEQIQKLTDAMAHTQAQLEQSQRELDEMRQQLAALQRQVAQGGTNTVIPTSADPLQSSSSAAPAQTVPVGTEQEIEQLREGQAVQESQIATHEQTKVESESKYPVRLAGMVLLNGFVNTREVDLAATPTLALSGPGSTGAAVRQTVLGFDARGPHLFGASSYGDLRVDFDGNPQPSNTSGSIAGYYNSNATLLRLRTAHAGLRWQDTTAYFALDRPILSPDAPTSLTAVAVPAFAWSGNLWAWNPQVGVTRDIEMTGSTSVRLQAALIDVADAPMTPEVSSQTLTPATTAERSRWPGVETRVALMGSRSEDGGSRFGASGYFSPHRIYGGISFDAWAGTLDARLVLPARLQLTATSYRGLALGGLGGGAFKDFVYKFEAGEYDFRALDDVGGWAELKEKASERLEFNAAYGMDNVFANELREYAVAGGTQYQNLARNRTYTGNVIYSPSAYLLFSLEYRHLESTPVTGPPAASNIIGLGAGYKF